MRDFANVWKRKKNDDLPLPPSWSPLVSCSSSICISVCPHSELSNMSERFGPYRHIWQVLVPTWEFSVLILVLRQCNLTIILGEGHKVRMFPPCPCQFLFLRDNMTWILQKYIYFLECLDILRYFMLAGGPVVSLHARLASINASCHQWWHVGVIWIPCPGLYHFNFVFYDLPFVLHCEFVWV